MHYASFIIGLLIYWLAFFVTCYLTNEIFQDQLYDEMPKYMGYRVMAGSFLLALLAAVLHPSFETLFTSNLAWTALQALVWVGVFILVFQFHPWHGLAIGLVAVLLIPGLTTMGVDNALTPSKAEVPINAKGKLPPRKSLNPGTTAPAPEPAKK
jgi:hypothetical protein